MNHGVDAIGGSLRHLSRWAGLILLAALASMVLACSETPVETSAENTAVKKTSLSDPVALIKKAFETDKDLKSFRANLDMKVTAQEQEVPVSMEMEQSQDKRLRIVMDMQTLLGEMQVELIIAEGSIYTKLPGSPNWVSMKADALAAATGQPLDSLTDPGGFYKNLFPKENVPWELYQVESLGSETVDGVETQHIDIQMDFSEVLDQLDTGTKEQLSKSMEMGGLNFAGTLEQVEVTNLEVWIDAQGHTRKTVMEMTLGADTAMSMDMRMFDFDQAISIEIPENVSEFAFP